MSFDICNDMITRIIQSLDPHGYNGVSIHMLKLCASSVSNPLSLVIKHSFQKECFHSEGEGSKYSSSLWQETLRVVTITLIYST